MPSIDDVLRNREAYPDDREIDWFGEKTTLKDLRDRAMPKSDMTRMSQEWANRERQLQSAVEGFQQQLAQAIEAKQPQATGTNGALTWDDLDRDPVLGLLTKRLRDAEQQYKAHEQRLAMHEQRYLQERYTEKLNTFKLDEPDKRAFLDFAIQNQITNLDVAYKAYTADREIQKAAKDAELRGVERGRKEASAPIPIGSRRSIAPDAPPPKTLDEAHDRALNDPEIWAAMRGEAPS